MGRDKQGQEFAFPSYQKTADNENDDDDEEELGRALLCLDWTLDIFREQNSPFDALSLAQQAARPGELGLLGVKRDFRPRSRRGFPFSTVGHGLIRAGTRHQFDN
jgi:hypothetical protein